jgi:hypothetical protein
MVNKKYEISQGMSTKGRVSQISSKSMKFEFRRKEGGLFLEANSSFSGKTHPS